MNSINGQPPILWDGAQLLDGQVDGHAVTGRGFHIDRESSRLERIVQTVPRRGWLWRERDQKVPKEPRRRPGKDGSGMISVALTLLTFLMIGLLWVSFEAQYKITLFERHQFTASAIEALSLDFGMSILALLALALSRIGRRSTPERWGIVGCAGFSALMNYATADSASWRSVLVYTLPSLFLAYIVDRAVSVIRRHFLGLEEERSPFAVLAAVLKAIGKALLLLAKGLGIFLLYLLRLVVAPWSTVTGLRRAIVQTAKLPEKPVKVKVIQSPKKDRKPPVTPKKDQPALPPGQWTPKPGTKAAQLIDLAGKEKDLATIPQSEVSALAISKAKEIGMHPGTGRAQLMKWVRQLQGAPQLQALPAGSQYQAPVEQDGGAES